jgi:hypothetical protein
MGGFIAPVPIDPVNLGGKPDSGPQSQAFTYVDGQYLYGGNLFTVLFDGITNTVEMWKSVDNGLTWQAVDHAAAPTGTIWGIASAFDNIQTVAVTLSNFATATTSAVSFDLLTETWGTIVPLVLADAVSLCILPLSVGGFAVAIDHNVGGQIGEYWIFTGAVWNGPAQVFTVAATGALPAGHLLTHMWGCVDSTDTIHLFYIWSDAGYTYNIPFYQSLSAGGALISSFQFPDMISLLSTLAFNVCVAGVNLIYPVYENIGGNDVLSLYVGTPLAAPVWTLFSTIDAPNIVSSMHYVGTPSVSFDGTTVRIVYTTDGVSFRVLETTDFVTWVFTPSVPFDYNLDATPAGFVFSGQSIAVGMWQALGLEFTAVAPDQTTLQRFFLPFILLPLGPVSPIYLDSQHLTPRILPNPAAQNCS